MKIFNLINSLFIVLSLVGCASTSDTSTNAAMEYHTNYFEKTDFKIVNQNTVKRDFSSDHQIMMSLLNRPMTADQQMMLAFAQQSKSHSSALVNTISLRGAKDQDQSYFPPYSPYRQLIANDMNSIKVNGPL